MNEAPCVGPYNFDFPFNSAPFEWSTGNRIIHPDKRGEKSDGTDNMEFKAEYPGIDYMLYHNLYYTIKSQYYDNPVNLMNQKITFQMPFELLPTNFEIGTTINPLFVGVFNNIQACNSISANSTSGIPHNVTYRAGNLIELQSGFHVTPASGSFFRAFISPYECAVDGSYRELDSEINSSTNFGLINNGFYSEGKDFVLHDIKSPRNALHFSYNELDENIDEEISMENSDSTKNLILINPNPVSEIANVILSTKEPCENIVIEINNSIGNCVHRANLDGLHRFQIDCRNWSDGIYVLKIYCVSQPEQWYSAKFIIAK